MVNSFEERTPGEIQTMSLCSDKNPISLDLHCIPFEKQPNDLFTFYTFTAGPSFRVFPPIILVPFLDQFLKYISIFKFLFCLGIANYWVILIFICIFNV